MKRLALVLLFAFIFSFPASAEETVSVSLLPMTFDEVSQLALTSSLDIQIAKFDAHIKRNDLLEAVSIYDTFLTGKASYKKNQFKKSSTISGSTSQTNEYSLGLSKKLPTGMVLGLEFKDTRSFTDSSFTSVNPAHDGVAKVSISQALGKNFFGLVDRNTIKITQKDIENSDWSSLGRIEASLAEIQKAFWKVVLSAEELDIKRGAFERAGELYEVYRKKRRLGLAEDPDFLAAEANKIARENDVLAAIDTLNTAQDDLLFLLNEDNREVRIRPLDKLTLRPGTEGFEEALTVAIENRRDYRVAKNNVEIKKLDIVAKKNSLWPEIDLEASFARNGLDAQYEKAWEQVYHEDNPELFLGVTVKFPIENRKARGQYNKAKIEKAKALLELKKVERRILTETNDLVTRINILAGRVLTNRRVVQLQERKLEAELKRFKYGRSSSDLSIRYQEDVLNAQLSLARTLFDYNAALIDMKVSQNILLDEYWEGEL